jgi:hypothetical protein
MEIKYDLIYAIFINTKILKTKDPSSTRTSSFITEVFLFKPVEIMSRSKYYNFAIKMLCDIHIERNYNVNYRESSMATR